MSNFLRVSVLLFSLLLIGCAAPPVAPVSESLNDSNSSVVTFLRLSQFVNGGVDYRIFIDDEYVGTLGNGDSIKRRVATGKSFVLFKPYELGIPTPGQELIEIDVVPGFHYEVLMAFNLDSISEFSGYISVERSSNFLIKRTSIEAN